MARRKQRFKDGGSAFPDREVIARAEGRFAKADKQRASIKADPKLATRREQERIAHIGRSNKAPKRP